MSDGVDLAPFGLAIGHATDESGATGLTVVRGIDGPFRAAHAVIGRASGSRELAVATPDHLVDRVDAIVLTGGSAYGLDAVAGAMRWMEERERGFAVGGGVVPLIPAAVLFDLAPLGRFDARPTPQMAYDACERASAIVAEQGSVGAGTGATVGKILGAAHAMKGGIGCVRIDGGGMRAAAIAAVNAFGDVRDAKGTIIAGARGPNGFVDALALASSADVAATRLGDAQRAEELTTEMRNTTLCVVALDVPMPRAALAQLARAATAALHRRITPTGTSFDGDVVFAVCPLPATPVGDDPRLALRAEALASRALEHAIDRAVRSARGRDGIPGLADS